jgi:hypothetical protein
MSLMIMIGERTTPVPLFETGRWRGRGPMMEVKITYPLVMF